MSASAGRRRGRRRRHGGEHEDEERWLLTYADMITLLMALFMVLFSISAVNKAKLQSLQQSLQNAFSGQILPGGTAIRNDGGGPPTQQVSSAPTIPAIQPPVDAGVDAGRLSAAGYADLHPIATNASADGRSHNRRVEIVLLRSGQGTAGGGAPDQ